VVEDDAVLVEMYKDKFVHEGFDVQTAGDGHDGIQKMRSFQPDVVILDLIMPRVSGFDVLKLSKNDPLLNKIPILVLTNVYVDAEDLVKNWGAEYYLLKSNYTPEDIVNHVRQILSKASAEQKN
jgi:two-component system chemotaxis response regulator CheY